MDYNDIYEDDLDLLELLTADSNSANQYLLFDGSNGEYYAMNVAKIVEILTYKNISMVKNSDSSLIKGTAKIRDEIATVINFDQWFGNELLNEDQYEYLILAGFGGYNLAIAVKNVEYIVTIDSANMRDNSLNNPKTTFIAQIKQNNQTKLCTVFDTDKMLLDLFGENMQSKTKINLSFKENISSKKLILFADDSRYIRKMVSDLLKELDLNFMEFENAQDLYDKLVTLDPKEVGLIVSDLEMPVMDGLHLIKAVKNNPLYNDLNIIIHTNMSNFITKEHLENLGASKIIDKVNMELLTKAIIEFLG